MITHAALVQRLARRNLGAWSVVERVQDIVTLDEAAQLERREQRTRLALVVHHDVPRGRGSARLDLDRFDGSADDVIDQAIALALAALGPAWFSAPAAAPARVNVFDPGLLQLELDVAARNTLIALRRPPGVSVTARLEILREQITVSASSGLHFQWPATRLRAEIAVTRPAASAAPPAAATTSNAAPPAAATALNAPPAAATASNAPPPATATASNAPPPATATASNAPPPTAASFAVVREARRIEDLALDLALADAAADLALLATASAPPTGPCALWLRSDAILHATQGNDLDNAHGGDLGSLHGLDLGDAHHADLGLWAIFAQQADSAIERQGLTRYRLRGEIAPGAAQRAEPLTITSDGALDFATRSAPVADDAVAVRRFPLIDRGIAAGLGLSSREAGLRGIDPNGGVRNLVVAPGTWSPAPLPATRTLEIRRLHAISLDPTTGEASLDIALGLEHRPGRPEPIPFTGGTLRLDLFAALAFARRSSQLVRRGPYHGPTDLLLEDVELLT